MLSIALPRQTGEQRGGWSVVETWQIIVPKSLRTVSPIFPTIYLANHQIKFIFAPDRKIPEWSSKGTLLIYCLLSACWWQQCLFSPTTITPMACCAWKTTSAPTVACNIPIPREKDIAAVKRDVWLTTSFNKCRQTPGTKCNRLLLKSFLSCLLCCSGFPTAWPMPTRNKYLST